MDGTNFTYLDIETIPSQSEDLLKKFSDEVFAPAQYKKQESIDQWLAENRDSVAKDRIAKTSFDPVYGHICTMAWAMNDGDIGVAHARDVKDEKEVLAAFFGAIDPYHSQTFVGHYISGFDLRFILCRAVVLGVNIPKCIPRDPKPWADRVFDTMTAWAGVKGTISMDNLCRALDISGKDGFDGSKVAAAWVAGEHDIIAEYCKSDVSCTRDIHRRFMAAGW